MAFGFVRDGALRLLAGFVAVAGDGSIERRFGAGIVERGLFAAMAASFDADAAGGFHGTVAYELTRPITSGHSTWWTVEVDGDGAHARPGEPSSGAAVTVRLPLSEFVRIAVGLADPGESVLQGRAAVEGDLSVAARLAEMFRAPRPR